MKTPGRKIKIRVLFGAIIIALVASFALLLASDTVKVNADTSIWATPRPTPKKPVVAKKVKYSEFPHDQKAHKVECSTCHKFPSDNWNKVRTGEAAFPDITEYPKHESCLKCHKQQFFKGTPPKICSICHTNPSAGNSTRHPYPNPREIFDLSKKGKKAESDFVVGFPHDKHIEIVSSTGSNSAAFVNASFIRGERKLAGEESCSVCHKTMLPQGTSKDEYITPPPAKLGDGFWLKKGTFKTAPIGHTTCFTCHSADSGMVPAPSDCAKCHHLKPASPAADFDLKLAQTIGFDDKVMMDSWKRRESAGKFQHEFFAHVDLPCSTCHTVATMDTADPLTLKVPVAACATCHATATVDDGGAMNYEADMRTKDAAFQCVKCHIIFGKQAIPKSHTDALTAATGK